MPETQSGTLDVNGGKLYYEVTGEGQPLVFIHAGIADLRMWDDQAAFFADQYRVIRYDTRGFGRTTTQDVEYSNRADLLVLLDHLGVDKAALVGCSRGGQIALDFTLEFPQRVTALIPVCAGLGGFEMEEPPEEVVRFEEMERLEGLGDYDALAEMEVEVWVDGFKRTAAVVDPRIRRLIYEITRANYEHAREGGRAVPLAPPATERLSSIRVPMLIIVTDMDTTYIRAAAEVLANNVPNAQKVLIHNSAHVPNLEHPDEFNQIVQAFLETI
jgi:3-oxoadipate enol-lactonase